MVLGACMSFNIFASLVSMEWAVVYDMPNVVCMESTVESISGLSLGLISTRGGGPSDCKDWLEERSSLPDHGGTENSSSKIGSLSSSVDSRGSIRSGNMDGDAISPSVRNWLGGLQKTFCW